MSDSPDMPVRHGVVWDPETEPPGSDLPHRVTPERQEAADVLMHAHEERTALWPAEPTLDFGSAAPLDDVA